MCTDKTPQPGQERFTLICVASSNDVTEFLASRRARITPERAELLSHGRGVYRSCRREEVASLAGVSVEYYKRLERGNLSGVSDLILEGLANELALDDAASQLLGSPRTAGIPATRESLDSPSTGRILHVRIRTDPSPEDDRRLPAKDGVPHWLKEVIVHLAFYAGWPRAMSAITIAKTVLPSLTAGPLLKENHMQTRYLGGTGLSVSSLCLGAMMFGEWGTKDHDESIRIIHRALDAGINFIDTADIYSAGESEEIVGKALAGGRRENIVLASKAHMPMGDDPNQRGNSRRWIVTEVENSLRRLQTDWIDLYQIHRPDPNTDIDETLGVLSDLVHQGKIRYIGHSTFPVSDIVEAQWTAERRGRERFRCEQPPRPIRS